jgi:hypothetical protein
MKTTFKSVVPGNLWSLPLLKIQLEDFQINNLIEATDISLDKNIDWSSQLAGEIKKGQQVFFEFPPNFDITALANEYIKSTFDFPDNLYVREAWVVSQFAGDYNPVHSHESVLSGIIYLKMPQQIKQGFNTINKNGSRCLDGCIHFIFDTYHRPSLKNFGPRAVLPEVGDAYLFPSYILHTVYPFKGDGERRCIAFNMDIK